jgi:kanamycin nucleotidyltransferase
MEKGSTSLLNVSGPGKPKWTLQPDADPFASCEMDEDGRSPRSICVRLAFIRPQAFFPRLKETVYSHPEETFRFRMKEVIIGDIYELVGKVRNAWAANAFSPLPGYTTYLAHLAAGLVGLSHRYLFHGSATLYEEALSLPHAPVGFKNLCQLVMSGRLTNKTEIFASVNTLWDGIELWAKEKNLNLTDDFTDLLRHDPIISP